MNRGGDRYGRSQSLPRLTWAWIPVSPSGSIFTIPNSRVQYTLALAMGAYSQRGTPVHSWAGEGLANSSLPCSRRSIVVRREGGEPAQPALAPAASRRVDKGAEQRAQLSGAYSR